jgi:hypothetical protein
LPLSTPATRKLAHTRVVTCHGYSREDGLWDIEGRIVDTKPYRFENRDRGGWIEADEALHDMSLRLTINLELEVIDAEGVIDYSPYNYCKSVTNVARNLIGLSIGPGWRKNSKLAMGGNRGCTHLTELLGPVSTTAIQTIVSEKIRRAGGKPSSVTKAFFNSCYSYAEDSPVVKTHWPEYYTGKTDAK